MQAALFVLVLLSPAGEFLKMDVSNPVWICPSGKPSQYLAFSPVLDRKAGGPTMRYHCYLWTPQITRYAFTSSSYGNAVLSSDGCRAVINNAYCSAVFRVGEDNHTGNPIGAAWIDSKLVTIVIGPDWSYELRLDGKRLGVPKNREPRLLAPSGRFLFTTTKIRQSREEFERMQAYIKYRVEVWQLSGKGVGGLHRDLGIFYWDEASTGAPTVFEVNSEGTVMSDLPSGGGVISRPYVVTPSKPAREVLDDNWDYSYTAQGGSTTVGRHFIFGLSARRAGEEQSATNDVWDFPQRLVWTDGRTMAVRPYPKDLVGLWGEGESTLCIATKAPGGVSIERVQLPPTKWEQHFLGDSVDQSPD